MLHLFLSVALLNAMPLLKNSFTKLRSQYHTVCNNSLEELIFPGNGKRPDCSPLQEQLKSQVDYCSLRAKLGQQRLWEETEVPPSLLEAEAAHREMAHFCFSLKAPSSSFHPCTQGHLLPPPKVSSAARTHVGEVSCCAEGPCGTLKILSAAVGNRQHCSQILTRTLPMVCKQCLAFGDNTQWS